MDEENRMLNLKLSLAHSALLYSIYSTFLFILFFLILFLFYLFYYAILFILACLPHPASFLLTPLFISFSSQLTLLPKCVF